MPKNYKVKHSLYGDFPRGRVIDLDAIRQFSPKFGDADLKRAIDIGAIEEVDEPVTQTPLEINRPLESGVEVSAGDNATKEVKDQPQAVKSNPTTPAKK